MSRLNEILSEGSVAVITGAAKGIGAALTRALAVRGMRLALFDHDGEALENLAASLEVEVLTIVGDAAVRADCERLHTATIERFGTPQLLVNNVGLGQRAGPWDSPEAWRAILDVNFTCALRMQNLFVPAMIASDAPAAIVNLGSKEGITTPPGNAAYSVAKAGIKVLTEQLEHELRGATGGRVSAHLLVPGFTYTPMNFPNAKEGDPKPASPWSAEELVIYAIPRLLHGDFYILCPDNDVTPELDAKRIAWAAGDMIENRPALSRWHPDHKEGFAKWLKQ